MPDMIVASTTATQEEIDHAVSQDWRKPIPPKEVVKTEPVVEQEEVPVASEEAETVPDSEPEVTQEEEKPKIKGGFQKKIDKLTREKSEALSAKEALERELSAFKERFEQLEKRLPETKEKPEAKTAPVKPLESEIGSKYKDWNEYNEALIDWKADRRLEAVLAERDLTAQERETKEIQEARDEGYRSAAKEFAEQTPDFNEAITNAGKAGMKLPEPIIDLIKQLPNGPAVTYYLVTNPDEALELIQMSPELGFAAVGRISQGLEKPKEQPKPPVKKVMSAAPVAVKPVAGHSARSSNSLQDISKTSTDEYIRVRQAQIRDREAARRY